MKLINIERIGDGYVAVVRHGFWIFSWTGTYKTEMVIMSDTYWEWVDENGQLVDDRLGVQLDSWARQKKKEINHE